MIRGVLIEIGSDYFYRAWPLTRQVLPRALQGGSNPLGQDTLGEIIDIVSWSEQYMDMGLRVGHSW